ncbi:hypothetical protein CMMCAS05_06085 [Clavibacter michiganensis subsp. michiganensis]|nr:hypothetical protein CMMCAS05_06085 [Clavibacter michiganensis subsp. michiganensis]
MRAREGRELGAAVLQGLELPGAVGVEPREVARELHGDLRHEDPCAVERLDDLGETRVVRRHPVEAAVRGVEHGGGVGHLAGRVLGRHELMGGGCGRPQVLEVREPVDALAQLLVLARLRRHGLDRVDRDAQLLGLTRACVLLRDEAVELGARRLPAAEHLLVLAEHGRERRTGEPVERLPLGGGRPQAHLVGLPVHHHELLADLREQRRRSPAAPDRRAAAALGRELARDDELAARAVAERVDVSPGVAHALGHGPVGRDDPAPLDDRALAPLPHGARVGARAEQQAQRGDDHGLARAGLAGDGREAGPERQRGLADHPEVADGDLLNHGRSAPSSR